MADSSLNQYEKRLYSVFKTFDVDNEEALNRSAVLALCDALQLEQRGAALVEALFERRPSDSPHSADQRVTFAQFRSGLLSVLGEPPAPNPVSVPAPLLPAAEPAASDDDSSGREVAPKFVFGSKKYGRRSRPARGRVTPPAASAPSPSPAPAPSPTPGHLELDHSSVVDCERALQLCRRLRMDGIDARLVQRVFDGLPAGATDTTVGDFFDRLNAALTVPMESPRPSDGGGGPGDDQDEETLPADLVVEAWERAGVALPQRLLAELGLGGAGAALPATRLARALDEEVRVLPTAPATLAALALARLRHQRAARASAAAAAERARLRADLDEAHRRARLLAQDVDESHARLEAERATALRRADARHSDALRELEAERGAERERAAHERSRLEVELARRAEAEQVARADADALRARCDELEKRAAQAEERRVATERERERLAGALRAAEERTAAAAATAEAERRAGEARAAELRAEAARLRDRTDELAAQLEARPGPALPAPPPPPPPAWAHEAAPLLALTHCGTALEGESPPVSLEVPAGVGAELCAARARLAEAEASHAAECARLTDLVKELESSLELLREEYDRCEEYWSGKLAGERAALVAEQRASDERLALLTSKIDEYERQFAPRLPAIPEAPALEKQAAELDAAAAELRRRRDELQRREEQVSQHDAAVRQCDAAVRQREAEARRRADELQRRERHLARLAHTVDALRRGRGCGCGCGPHACGAAGGGGGGGAGGGSGGAEAELRLRAARAEAGAARLAQRLAAADRLVKDLYVESCTLGPSFGPL